MTTDLTLYQPKGITELREFCQLVTKTGLVPTAYRGKPEDAMVAIMFGHETGGLGPLTSLQFVAVINGRPGYYSDAVPGIALNKGLITDIEESTEGTPFHDDFKHVVIVTKANGKKHRSEFSVADAKRAGLWDKAGPWKQYPRRMLQWRAKGFGVRDAAPHLLFGSTVEELRDIEDQAQRHPEDAKDVTPPRNYARAGTAPEYVEVADPYGEIRRMLPSMLADWAAEAARMASDDELEALAEGNPDVAEIRDAVEAEELRRAAKESANSANSISGQNPAASPAAEPVEPGPADPLHILGVKGAMGFLGALRLGLERASIVDADRYWELYRDRAKAADEKVQAGDYAGLEQLVAEKIGGKP